MTINRDRTPELPKRYGVSAYPSLVFLGHADENVFRFSGFKEPVPFLAEMHEGLRRWQRYLAGARYDDKSPRADSICASATCTSFPAPSLGIPDGMCMHGRELLLVQNRESRRRLFRIDPDRGVAHSGVDIDFAVRDVCSDGEDLYAMPQGWTKGDPIRVLDPATGRVLREIVTEENRADRSSGASGIEWRDGALVVLTMLRGIAVIDPATGEVRARHQPKLRYVSGLSFDGERFVTANRTTLYWLDADSFEVVREVPVAYPVRSLAAARSGELLLMEQPVFGHDRDHQRVQIWPEDVVVHRVVFR